MEQVPLLTGVLSVAVVLFVEQPMLVKLEVRLGQLLQEHERDLRLPRFAVHAQAKLAVKGRIRVPALVPVQLVSTLGR